MAVGIIELNKLSCKQVESRRIAYFRAIKRLRLAADAKRCSVVCMTGYYAIALMNEIHRRLCLT